MGLTVHYELRLPAATTRQEITDKLSALRDSALQLPVADVSPIYGDGSMPKDWRESGSLGEGSFRFSAEINAEPYESPMVGDLSSAAGFTIDLGEGSEAATFGFIHRRDGQGENPEWFWYCSCKTQYASNVSDQHFVVVHTALIAVLDRAVELGIAVDVGDEAGYWESRDEASLIESVQGMNRLVARFGGALSDALGSERVRGSIFEHPRFERLEMGE